jgi:hypothetical protein
MTVIVTVKSRLTNCRARRPSPVQATRFSNGAKTLTLDLADMRTSHRLDLKLGTAASADITRALYITVPALAE